MLSISDMLFLISQVQVNQSPIGPISPANSKEDSPSSETTSQSNREQSFPRRKADIISMSPTPALGVRTIFLKQLSNPLLLSHDAAHRTLIVRNLKGLEDIIPYTSVHWEMLEKGSSSPTAEHLRGNVWSLTVKRMALCNAGRENPGRKRHIGPNTQGLHPSSRDLLRR